MDDGGWRSKRQRSAPQQAPALSLQPPPAAAAEPPAAGLWDDDDSDDGRQTGWHTRPRGAGLAARLLPPSQLQVQAGLWDSTPLDREAAAGVDLGWDSQPEAAAAGSGDADAAARNTQGDAAQDEEADDPGDDVPPPSSQEEEEEEEELTEADFGASRDDVIERIEQLAASLVADIAGGQLPQLTCVSTAASNVHMAPRHARAARATSSTAGSSQLGGSRLLASQAGTQQSGDVGGINELHGLLHGLQPTPASTQPGEEWQPDDGSLRGDTQPEQLQPEGGGDGGEPAGGSSSVRVLRLGSKTRRLSLTASNGQQASSIVRVLQLLDSVHALLRSGRTATQRDVYYSLVGRAGFNSPRDVTSAIQAALAMLRVPRSALGISAASKGAVAGCLLLRPRAGEAWVDCRSVGPSGRPIPGEVGAVDAMAFRPAGSPRFILVVEKDAVFQSLVESRLAEELPCILITGRGMPDIASRAFLAALVEASRSWASSSGLAATQPLPLMLPPGAAPPGTSFASQAALSQQRSLSRFASQAPLVPQQAQPLPVLGLVDWNPGGVGILLTYKLGSAALGLEAARYAVPSLCWLGVTSDMLQEGRVPTDRCHALSQRDGSLITGLTARLAACGVDAAWGQELGEMAATGLKADIEALPHEVLLAQLKRRVLARQYLPA